MIEELDMEPNAAPNSHAAPRLLFSLLGLAVGLCIATYAPPVYAQDSVEPTGCADDAVVHDDGDDTNGSDEDSVAVGCGAAVQQPEDTSATDTVKQPLFTLDAGNDGDVDEYLVQVNCDNSNAGVCAGRTGNQLVAIGKALHDRLQTVGDDMVEADGVRTAGPLTKAEMDALTAALMNEENVRPLADVAVGLNRLTDTGTDIMRSASTSTNEVTGGVAVGSGAMVKADGGIAIGDGANVGSDMTTEVSLMMDGMEMVVVGYEEDESGGGGDNGIAIGNGASAMGAGSIAIGNGAKAMEDGQVMIGGHDIGAMANGMDANAAGIARNSGRLDSHDAQLDDHNERLMAHGTKIDENRGMINSNSGKIENNATRINENRGMINSNTSMIGNNAGRINENRGMINANMQMLGTHATMIGNNKTRLDNHATVLMNHDGRLMAHAATLAEHDGRLDTHDQVLAGHAAGINNNAMEIQMLDERVSQVAAASAALSAVPNAPDMDEQFFVGVGVGSHGGESSVAAGVSGRLGANKNIVVNAGIANSGSGTSVRAGVGWSF